MNIQGENKSLKFYNKEGVKVYDYYTYSDGYWYEYTRDENGNQLTFKNSDGINTGFDIPEYTIKDLVEKLGNFKLIK
tara:strand:+ start:245 stop:475 length:231 start_codon:yes stop_codon:yes gene_type:complete